MKFNEKLIELRKKQGLSQEELGNKLNVTRQTISKWELGQTTPEMDKLVEISKMFNISVDELINETTDTTSKTVRIEDQTIKSEEDNKREKNMKMIIIGILVIVVILIVGKLAIALPIFNKVSKGIDNATDKQQNIVDRVLNTFDKTMDKVEQDSGELSATDFNENIQMWGGTQIGPIVDKCLDNIINNNNDQSKKITVKYNEIETQEANEIESIKEYIDDSQEYEVSFEYDEQGYINKVKIEKSQKSEENISKEDVSMFNFRFESFSGTEKGMFVKECLDSVITSNKTKDRKITVKYNETETQDVEEIKNMKTNFEQLNDYEVSFDYDEYGFINKVTIENL